MAPRSPLAALLALVVCFAPGNAQESAQPPPSQSEWAPSKYWIIKAHLLPKERGPQAELGYYLEPKLVPLETIQFDKGDPVITPEMYKRLHYVARFIRSFPQFPLILEGHADNQGKAAENKKLAAERAEGVRLFLSEVYRLPMGQMHVVGYGEERPIATNNTDAGRYRNRRVDIVLMDARPR